MGLDRWIQEIGTEVPLFKLLLHVACEIYFESVTAWFFGINICITHMEQSFAKGKNFRCILVKSASAQAGWEHEVSHLELEHIWRGFETWVLA